MILYRIMHQMPSTRYLIGFSYETSAGRGIDNVFFLDKSGRKMYTIFSEVQRQIRNKIIT
jgi:hypothetical protein